MWSACFVRSTVGLGWISILIVFFFLSDPIAPTAAAQPSGSSDTADAPTLILAVEDTLDLTDIFKIDPLEVRANRLKISEIVRRCIEREEELQSRIQTHVYTQFVKTIFHVGVHGEETDRLLVIEEVARVRMKRPDVSEVAPLKHERYMIEDGERKEWPQEDETVALAIRMEEFDQLPFYLADKDDYDFEILSRKIAGNHVIYEVFLEPKSDFEIAPQGKIWIDTSNFQILREEFDFGDRVPMPLLVKSVGPIIRERERIGDLWVWKRILMRADLRIGWLRALEKDIPDRVEFVMVYEDHMVNEDWAVPDSTLKGVDD